MNLTRGGPPDQTNAACENMCMAGGTQTHTCAHTQKAKTEVGPAMFMCRKCVSVKVNDLWYVHVCTCEQIHMHMHRDGMMMYSCIHIVLLWMLLKEISSQVLTNFWQLWICPNGEIKKFGNEERWVGTNFCRATRMLRYLSQNGHPRGWLKQKAEDMMRNDHMAIGM